MTRASSRTENNRRRQILAAALLAFGLFAIYTSTIARTFGYDSLCYALDVERLPWGRLFIPYHMLFSPIARAAYIVAQALGYPLRSLFFMQQLNAVLGAFSIALFFILLRRAFDWRKAILGALALAFSHVFWMESVDPGCYGLASLAAVIVLGLFLFIDRLAPVTIGLAHAAAILSHQLLVLVIPAFLWILRGKRSRRYLFATIAATGGIYLGVGMALQGKSFGETILWTFSPVGSPEGKPLPLTTWWQFDLLAAFRAQWDGLWESFFPAAGGLQAGAQILVLIAAGLVIWDAIRRVRSRRLDRLEQSLWIWLFMISLFITFYQPGTIRFRLLFLPAAIFLALSAWSRHQRTWMEPVIAGAILTMALVNYTDFIRPRSNPLNNPNLIRVAWVSRIVQPGDGLLIRGEGPASILNIYVPYFVPQANGRSLRGYLYENPGGDLGGLADLVRETRRSRRHMWVEADLLDRATQEEIERQGRLAPGAMQRLTRSWKIESVLQGPAGYRLVELR